MNDKEKYEKLVGFEEKAKHKIPPCDLGYNDYAKIELKNEDARKLKELLNMVLKQLEQY